MSIDFAKSCYDAKIAQVIKKDVRFPTSLSHDGSDAVHTNPDYSLAYIIIIPSDGNLQGHGFTFTLGSGTDVVLNAVSAYEHLFMGKTLREIFGEFRHFSRSLTNHSQLRWLGPDKGVTHLAVAAILNAFWDLWAKLEGKPLWRLVADMTAEEIVNIIDFHHLTDAVTEDEALRLLRTNLAVRDKNIALLHQNGITAYITSAGWLGYADEKVERLCKEKIDQGWQRFKMKVGVSVEDDYRRAKLIRREIGEDRRLMMDANQVWDVDEAVSWMRTLAEFRPLWIEEPTNPDDVIGHKTISQALNPLGICVATGEHCANKVLFKQFITQGAMQFCQIDSCRLASLNEIMAVLLMAAKYKVPVCPHAGGVGLCELVSHLAAINFICFSPDFENVMVEYAEHLHEHFVHPAQVKSGHYLLPMSPGYSAEMKQCSLEEFAFPSGKVWQKSIADKK